MQDVLTAKNNEIDGNKDSLTDDESLWTYDGLKHQGTGVNIKGQGSLYFIGNTLDERSYFK